MNVQDYLGDSNFHHSDSADQKIASLLSRVHDLSCIVQLLVTDLERRSGAKLTKDYATIGFMATLGDGRCVAGIPVTPNKD